MKGRFDWNGTQKSGVRSHLGNFAKGSNVMHGTVHGERRVPNSNQCTSVEHEEVTDICVSPVANDNQHNAKGSEKKLALYYTPGSDRTVIYTHLG